MNLKTNELFLENMACCKANGRGFIYEPVLYCIRNTKTLYAIALNDCALLGFGRIEINHIQS